MNVTSHQLRVFAAVAESGSITKAAQRLHLTQPTVSVQLKQLGEQLGAPVFEIVGRRLYLTDAGRAVLEHHDALARSEALLHSRLAQLRGLESGQLRLSFVTTAQYLIPTALGRFCADYPEIDIALQILNRGQVIERLKANKDDLYVMTRPPEGQALRVEPFLPNPLVLIAPRAHALCSREAISWDDLQRERFILREPGSGTRMAVDEFLAARGLELNIKYELGSNESIWQAVAAGLGLAVISRHALLSHAEDSPVRELAVDGLPIRATWYLVHPEGKALSPPARRFLEYLRELGPRDRAPGVKPAGGG